MPAPRISDVLKSAVVLVAILSVTLLFTGFSSSFNYGVGATFKPGLCVYKEYQPDFDNDTVSDCQDNCPFIFNPEQMDADKSMIGDACNEDADGDEYESIFDNCPSIFNPDQLNSDNHGGGDLCDVCPADKTDSCVQAASALITSTGGTLATPNGIVKLVIPSGAIEESASFSITAFDKSTLDLSTFGITSTDWLIAGDIYQIDSSVSEFLTPVTLTINYDPLIVRNPFAFDIWWLNEATSSWEAQQASVDIITHTYTLQLSHLSVYMLALDIRDKGDPGGDKNDTISEDPKKLTICHVPSGNKNKHTISIGEPAAQHHLSQHDGDYLGECADDDENDDNDEKVGGATEQEESDDVIEIPASSDDSVDQDDDPSPESNGKKSKEKK